MTLSYSHLNDTKLFPFKKGHSFRISLYRVFGNALTALVRVWILISAARLGPKAHEIGRFMPNSSFFDKIELAIIQN